MLSKSTARLFFIGTTLIFSLVFLGLTFDTVRQVPHRTNQDQLTESVKRGQWIWTENNCMGCHTLLGEGAYYAPELTKVYDRRGAEWMKMFLRDPQAMFPGERKMSNYGFSEQDLDDLVAFFKWIGNIDTNNWPPEPKHQQPGAAQGAPTAMAGSETNQPPAIYNSICAGCHIVGGRGGNVGPELDGIGSRMSTAELDAFIADPAAVRPGTSMPAVPLSDSDHEAIVDFLSQLK